MAKRPSQYLYVAYHGEDASDLRQESRRERDEERGRDEVRERRSEEDGRTETKKKREREKELILG